MTPTRKRRALVVLGLVAGLGVAASIAIVSLNENMRFFISPSDVQAQELPPDRQFRLGGLVVDGSIEHADEGLEVSFAVTDGAAEVPVVYQGILPDLFREGQGIVAHGFLRQGRFEAHEVLAKHDEEYMPPEVKKALEKTGHPGPGSATGAGG
jgi:cytochrome c-type biogenesis protein CcmE